HAGFPMKDQLAGWLREAGTDFQDFGAFSADSVDYPLIAAQVAGAVAAGTFARGILICGTGIGMGIAANKVAGIRAAQCSDPLGARSSRLHNDANVLTLSGRLLGPEMVREICRVWLDTAFEGGRHGRRVGQIQDLEGHALWSATQK